MIWQDRNMSECFIVFLKVFYEKLYMHSLVDKFKWFYENARCYKKIYTPSYVSFFPPRFLCANIWVAEFFSGILILSCLVERWLWRINREGCESKLSWYVLWNYPAENAKFIYSYSVTGWWRKRMNILRNYDVSNQNDATIFIYWSFYWSIWICSTCFGRQTRPSSRAFLTPCTN